MVEIGRFRHGAHVFSGSIDADRVTERSAPGERTVNGTTVRTWDYGDLVLLSPVDAAQIIEVFQTPSGSRFRLRPSSSVGPHRAMVAVPRDGRVVTARPALGWVLGRGLHGASADEVREGIQGCLTAILFREESPFPDDPCSLATVSYEGFTTLGGTIAQRDQPPVAPPVLWHNGRELGRGEAGSQPTDPVRLIAGISSWIRLAIGDLILMGAEGGGASIRAGDHVECRCPPLRPAAVNIGLRGSA